MSNPNSTKIHELLSRKRQSQFCLIFSAGGLITGWLYSTAIWLIIFSTCLLWLVSAAGLLWLARNPGANVFDFYKTPYWWLQLLDFEINKEPQE
ncbi:hypothetical protein G7000_20330 [Pseudomonas stutzeri]|jgi:hypothetical protein|nr:hypothetical protein [Stutzerimonas stutzeri]